MYVEHDRASGTVAQAGSPDVEEQAILAGELLLACLRRGRAVLSGIGEGLPRNRSYRRQESPRTCVGTVTYAFEDVDTLVHVAADLPESRVRRCRAHCS